MIGIGRLDPVKGGVAAVRGIVDGDPLAVRAVRTRRTMPRPRVDHFHAVVICQRRSRHLADAGSAVESHQPRIVHVGHLDPQRHAVIDTAVRAAGGVLAVGHPDHHVVGRTHLEIDPRPRVDADLARFGVECEVPIEVLKLTEARQRLHRIGQRVAAVVVGRRQRIAQVARSDVLVHGVLDRPPRTAPSSNGRRPRPSASRPWRAERGGGSTSSPILHRSPMPSCHGPPRR